jgi:para-aminobenzoate synthetase component 1
VGRQSKKQLRLLRKLKPTREAFTLAFVGFSMVQNLDSGVMIRYIENQDGRLIYKSGGGITVNSEPDYEYNEMIDKIYVPIP